MRHIALFLLVLIPGIFFPVFAQKKNGNPAAGKATAILQTSMQKKMDALTHDATPSAIASFYQNLGLRPVVDSNNFLQPFSLDLGKEIKPATILKINGIPLEAGVDYWPFAFCPNVFFAGTAIWGQMEARQPFLYDLKTVLENNPAIAPTALLQLIKEKTNALAGQKIPALLVYNSSEINDGLNFSANDTAGLTAIPVIYFTRSGIKKLKNESAIANAIDAGIVLGEKIITGINTLAYLDNSAANTVVITTSNNNLTGAATTMELARLLKEICQPNKKNKPTLNTAHYTNNNYLFASFDDVSPNNYGGIYFLEHLPFEAFKINYALHIGINNLPNDSTVFLAMGNTSTSALWDSILQKNNLPFNIKMDNSLPVAGSANLFYQQQIPNLYLFNPATEAGQKNKATIINQNNIQLLRYIMQLIDNANNYGKLPFNKK